ncbi:MAG: cytochrome c [Myxococcota bacterium]
MTRFFTTPLLIAAFAIGGMIPMTAFAGDAEAGKAQFLSLCVACHGESGKGDGPTGLALAAAGQAAPRDFTIGEFVLDPDKDGTKGSDSDLKAVITKGALVFGGSPLMAPIVGLTDAELDNLIAFIRSLKE